MARLNARQQNLAQIVEARVERRHGRTVLGQVVNGQNWVYKHSHLQKAVQTEDEYRTHLSHREIREQNEKVYQALPEIMQKKADRRRQEAYRTNRLMAQIYTKKLQEKVLQGKVSWSYNQKCM
jgi:hypothetical protein